MDAEPSLTSAQDKDTARRMHEWRDCLEKRSEDIERAMMELEAQCGPDAPGLRRMAMEIMVLCAAIRFGEIMHRE